MILSKPGIMRQHVIRHFKVWTGLFLPLQHKQTFRQLLKYETVWFRIVCLVLDQYCLDGQRFLGTSQQPQYLGHAPSCKEYRVRIPLRDPKFQRTFEKRQRPFQIIRFDIGLADIIV